MKTVLLRVIPILGLTLALFLGGLLLANVGVSLHYHPDDLLQPVVIGCGGIGVLLLQCWLFVALLRGRPWRQWQRWATLVTGTILALLGAYGLIVDSGDWIISIWVVATGVVVLAAHWQARHI